MVATPCGFESHLRYPNSLDAKFFSKRIRVSDSIALSVQKIQSRSGGIGRRARFRGVCPQGRVGSSPTFGTFPSKAMPCAWLFQYVFGPVRKVLVEYFCHREDASTHNNQVIFRMGSEAGCCQCLPNGTVGFSVEPKLGSFAL